LAGALATCVGLLLHQTWRELPAERFALSLVLAGLALAAAWPLRRALRLSLATALAAAWALALIVWVGPLPVLAAATLGAAALAIGGALTPAALPARIAIATCVGLAIIAGVAGWTTTLPLHRPWLWWPLLLAIVALRRHSLAQDLRLARQAWRDAVSAAPRAAAATVLLLGLASTACWVCPRSGCTTAATRHRPMSRSGPTRPGPAMCCTASSWSLRVRRRTARSMRCGCC
jgi:hypothetical protein